MSLIHDSEPKWIDYKGFKIENVAADKSHKYDIYDSDNELITYADSLKEAKEIITKLSNMRKCMTKPEATEAIQKLTQK